MNYGEENFYLTSTYGKNISNQMNSINNIKIGKGLEGALEITKIIENRINEFEKLGKLGKTTFKFSPFINLNLKVNLKTELAFCLSTANSSAVSGLKFQKSLENKRIENPCVEDFSFLLKRSGVRFYKKKACYIRDALKKFNLVKFAIEINSQDAREKLVENIRGFGYKEASHFLRNVGVNDVAIIDRHILKYLFKDRYINEIPNISPKKYKKFEVRLRKFGRKKHMNLAELDLYLWYKVTKKILK